MADDDGRAKLIWRLSQSGLGTTLTAAGNSGSYTASNINAVTAIDLRRVTDLGLMVYVGGIAGTGTPTITVTLGIYDGAGNLFPAVLTTTGITATGGKAVYAGLFSGPGAQIVFPEWGQVAWTVSGTNPSFSQVEISLYGR